MSEVDSRAASGILEFAARAGVPLDSLVDDLGFTRDDLALPFRRIAWSDYTVFLDRVASELGGLERLVWVGSGHSDQPAASVMRALAAAFVSIRAVYMIGAKWWGPRFFACTQGEQLDLGGGRTRQIVTILPGHRDSEAFFHLMHGVLVATPRVLGLQDAEVSMRLSPRRAEYDIQLPPDVSWFRHTAGWFRRQRAMATTLAELDVELSQLGEALGTANDAHQALLSKTRELETLGRVSHRLATRTDISGVVDVVLSLCDDGELAEGVALKLYPLGDEFAGVTRARGGTRGAADRVLPLHTASREIGELSLWGERSSELLDDLEPAIGLALEGALRFESLALQSRRLEAEVGERIRAERGLQLAQRMEVVGQLAGGLAHDFNNALMAMSGHAELALGEAGVPDGVRARVGGIVQEIDRSSRLIRQVLDFSRPILESPIRIHVGAATLAIEELLQRLAGEAVQLDVLVEDGRAVVMLDDGQLEQVLVNLVTNARDAMAQGGQIGIRISGGNATGGDVTDEFVRIEVSDNGSGIDAELQSRVFEPFVTTKSRGTGLGLAMVLGVVRGAGGAVELDSEVGKGTTFSILLPVVDAHEDSEPARAATAVANGGGTSVLLVEDSPGVRTVVRSLLETGDYRVLDAASVEAAVDLCRSCEDPIELLITDMALPDGDGLELADRLKLLRPELRAVLFVSGYPEASLEDAGTLPPAHALLRKPFTSRQLLESIAAILHEAVDPDRESTT